MLPLLRPYVLAACQMRKQKNKKKNLSNIVKRINCDFIYQLKKLKRTKQNKTKNWLYCFLVNISKKYQILMPRGQ